MAEINTVIAEASQDLQTIENFVNLPAGSDVRPRLLPSVNVGTLAGTRDAIFKAGGLPAEPFETKALMEVSELVDGKYAQVTDDTVNNGLYVKTAGVWVKSAYDPLSSAKAHTDSVINSISKTIIGKNLYDNDAKNTGKFLNNDGNIRYDKDWSISDYIPVTAGKAYTVSATARRAGLAFFADKTTVSIAGSYNTGAGTLTIVAPATAKYLVINVDSNTITAINVQVEQAASATAYEPYSEKRYIDASALPDNIVLDTDLQSAIADIDTNKDYEVTYTTRNMFDKSQVIQEQLLDNSGAVSTNGPLVGWSTSHLIKVVEGATYTLSGSRGRGGLSFFASEDTSTPLQYIKDSTMPLTVTAPVGAKFVVFNITQPTDLTATNLQFEEGAVASSYVEHGSFVGIDANFIVDNNVSDNPLVFANFAILGNNSARITANNDIDLQSDLLLTKTNTRDNSTVFNFTGVTVDGTLLRALNDDVAPLRIDGTTVGANHGYVKTTITSEAHGKTNADVGSVWTDGAAQFIIIDIVSVDKLSVTARTSNAELTANILTHVSGADNTTEINSKSNTSNQWYPVYKNRKLTVFVDGAKIDASAIRNYNYSDSVALHETYEIMSKSDIVEWLILNGGVARTNYDAEPSILYNNSYVFDKEGGCVIYTSATAYKSIPFQDYMGTQSVPLDGSVNRFYYVPKTVAFNQNSIDYDFTKLQNMSVAPTSSIAFTAAKNEVSANPVDRLIQFNATVGYATGFLPLLDAEPNIRSTNASRKYLQIRGGTSKVYPSLIDSDAKTTLEVGDSYAAIAYRKYFKRDSNRTAKYVVRSNIADFLYLDWHSAKTDVIELPEDLVGRAFTVHEKSSNVTLLSAFATNNIAIKVDATKSYGYLVLRFDR